MAVPPALIPCLTKKINEFGQDMLNSMEELRARVL
jgi:hypothetical protein